MAGTRTGLGDFLQELKRRRVFRVAAAYAVVGWGLVEVADAIFPHLRLPDWSVTLVIALLLLGFPVAITLAWAFDLTGEWVRRADPEPESAGADSREDAPALSVPRRVAIVAFGLPALVGLALLVSRFSGPGEGANGRASPSGAEPGVIAPGADTARASLAVLPFVNLGDAGTDDFADGVAEDIRTQLGRLSELRVIGRTSVMRYKGSDMSAREIAGELGISHVLEGTVQRSGDGLRITVRLLRAGPDELLWSDRYDREAADVFAIQTDVAERVASALVRELSPAARQRIAARPASDLRAYELHLAGRALMVRRDVESLERAAELLEQATRLDPTYAPAYAALADAYILMSTWAGVSSREMAAPAREAAERALALDPGLAEAWTSLAYIRAWFERDWAAAERHFGRAIELNPNYSTAHHWHAVVLSQLGRLDEAKVAIERARALDPASLIIRTIAGLRHHFAREYEAARVEHRGALDLDPEYPVGHLWMAQAYAAEDRLAEALRHYRRAAELDPQSPVMQSGLAYGLARSGEAARAREVVSRIEGGEGGARSPRYSWLALAYVGLGDHDAAFAALRRGLLHDGFVANLLMEPLFDPLRGDPRYDRILAELDLRR